MTTSTKPAKQTFKTKLVQDGAMCATPARAAKPEMRARRVAAAVAMVTAKGKQR